MRKVFGVIAILIMVTAITATVNLVDQNKHKNTIKESYQSIVLPTSLTLTKASFSGVLSNSGTHWDWEYTSSLDRNQTYRQIEAAFKNEGYIVQTKSTDDILTAVGSEVGYTVQLLPLTNNTDPGPLRAVKITGYIL